jgi:TetR/AcrR family transcriptional regulator
MPAPAAKVRKLSRDAILVAAEAAFAEHGFSGARIDDIAAASGFNKTLIFRHYEDKLGLYSEVLKRTDEEIASLQRNTFAPLLQAKDLVRNRERFRSLLKAMAETTYDFMLAHPRTLKILGWEAAEGWKTFTRIATQFPTEELKRIEAIFRQARRAGLLRSGFHPLVQMSMVSQICVSYLSSLPLYQLLVSGEDLSSERSLEEAKKYVVEAIVRGMVTEE